MDDDINARDEVGATRLFNAVSDEVVAEVRRLLALGADPNIPDVNGITPLMDAAHGGNLEIAILLMERGANPYLLDNFGDSALAYAQQWKHADVVRFLQRRTDASRLEAAHQPRRQEMAREKREVAEIVRALPETREIDVYYAFVDGELAAIAASEDHARCHLPESDSEQAVSLEIKREIVGIVEGSVQNCRSSDDPRPHVGWECPACREFHISDLYDSEPNPALWFCESGFGEAKFLVRWRRKESG